LTEHYTVTDIPDSVIDLIGKQISDSETIKLPEYVALLQIEENLITNLSRYYNSRVSSSGTGLLALPTLILAMFKATAPSFYSMKLNSGQMYLYNDCMYLTEKIRSFLEDKGLSKFTSDIESLEKFGKASYSKEMQTQRTIITDLLDGVQGFANCSEQPFLGECENAINATVDRIRDIYREWGSILSHSALLQAVGSLISTVLDKVIIDIEDLSDISETESQRLVSFCNSLSKLEDIFMPEAQGEEETLSMAAVYVTNWLKFQYLINILESSLADIKFLWAEGELPLEFSPEEVIDLIEALFAESEHRRKAIAEIRRTAHGR
jgi:protein transport protein DSL1/ZW10